MKYIDADYLKVEIEKHIKEVKDAAERFAPNMGFFHAKLSGIYDVMAFIATLQKEQPEVDLGKEYKEYVEDDPVFSKLINRNAGMAVARHFYELGKNSK